MQSLPPETIHPAMIASLTRLVAWIAGVATTLVAVLYYLLRQTDGDQQKQLDEGYELFTKNALLIQAIQKDTESLREWVVELEKELDLMELKCMKEHDILCIVKHDHDRIHKND